MNSEHEVVDPVSHRSTSVVRQGGVRPLGLPSLSWGAVVAGLFIVLAVGWLLELLGVAIGVSIADASDSINMGGTLAPAASIWLLVCWLVSFFLGALVTARLAGRIDDTSGMLHGLTLWAVATVVSVSLTYYGMSVLVNSGTQAIGVAAKGVGNTLSATATGIENASSGVASVVQQVKEDYGDQIQRQLYDHAAEMAANNVDGLSEKEVRNAVHALDERTMRRIVLDLTNDDSEGAAQLLADNTKLSEADAKSIVDETYKALEEQFGNPDNNKSLAADVKAGLIENVDSYLASLDQPGGVEVREQDVQKALSQLDAEDMQDIGMRLVKGDVDGAKRALVRHTSLETAQVNALVEGASEDINNEIAAYQKELDETVEAASTYTSQVLWVIFAGAAAALAAALGGGYLGADSSRRQYPYVESTSRELTVNP